MPLGVLKALNPDLTAPESQPQSRNLRRAHPFQAHGHAQEVRYPGAPGVRVEHQGQR
ncbi:GM21640 [Drosophila sechellia]|uniref:GM21640 n=1 Tax=Drosophila sechellia TaxID=7238 RepID=B4HSF3_DROSE|nr:GM21640 [Drosophila sechellia]